LNGWAARNWSGYAVSGVGFTTVSGSWRVPTVNRTKNDRYSSTWVGIDGFNNSNLIQAGTEQDWFRGQPYYQAWWEILPAVETPIPASKITVSPGDAMTVSITKGIPNWTITVSDTTTGRSFTTLQAYTGPGTSAEWIQEAPTIGRATAALAVDSTVVFDHASVNGGNANLTAADAGVMTRRRQQISTPSLPDADADGFAVQYGSVAPAAPPS
jgi:hypothetical protein